MLKFLNNKCTFETEIEIIPIEDINEVFGISALQDTEEENVSSENITTTK